MDSGAETRERILRATIELLLAAEDKTSPKPPSLREVATEAGVSLGLINYHFESQDKLIRRAVRWYVHTIVIEPFDPFGGTDPQRLSPIDRLTLVIMGPLDFIFQHPRLGRISILNDFAYPADDDNSAETWQGIHYAIRRIAPNGSDELARLAAWSILGSVHEAFLRPDQLLEACGLDLTKSADRRRFAMSLAEDALSRSV